MDNPKLPIVRLTEESRTETDDVVVREQPLTIFLNDEELVTMLCSPRDLDSLAVGFLFSEGLLKDRDEIQRIVVDDQGGWVRVTSHDGVTPDGSPLFKRFIASGSGRGSSLYQTAGINGQTRVESQITLSGHEVLTLVQRFQHNSEVYRATGGVHSAALCDTEGIIVFAEDIGRHNAIDKVFGKCVLQGIAVTDRIVLSSGRISSEILLKVARRKVPVLISVAPPTDLGVRLADDTGITLIGFVRDGRMNIYSHGWRVV